MLLGSFINAMAIVICGAIGMLIGQRFKERYREITMQAIGLATIAFGLQMAFNVKDPVVLLGSMVFGALTGELLNIEGALMRFAEFVRGRKKTEQSRFVRGFVTSSLIFCVGSMAILGPIEAGTKGTSNILYAKTLVDAVSAIAFASTMGIGVIASAGTVLIYEGGLTLLASALGTFLTSGVTDAITGTGGILLMALGLNILNVLKVRVGNLLPALIFAALLASLLTNASH